MCARLLTVLIATSIAVTVVADLHLLPDHNLAILYTVPVILAALTESCLLVITVSSLVLLLDLASVILSQPPVTVWPLSFVALFAVSYLALRVAGQRAVIRRQEETAARTRWTRLLFADAAHELRTPLTVILGYAQRLENDPTLPRPLYDPVLAIDRSAQRMRQAIDDLLQRWQDGGESTP